MIKISNTNALTWQDGARRKVPVAFGEPRLHSTNKAARFSGMLIYDSTPPFSLSGHSIKA